VSTEWGAIADDDPRVQAGLAHLQRAARELIAASRTLLDVAEDLVEDPKAAAGLLEALGSIDRLGSRLVGRGGPGAGSAQGTGSDDDDGPPVQRIPVS
jgi:hypothetical protein